MIKLGESHYLVMSAATVGVDPHNKLAWNTVGNDEVYFTELDGLRSMTHGEARALYRKKIKQVELASAVWMSDSDTNNPDPFAYYVPNPDSIYVHLVICHRMYFYDDGKGDSFCFEVVVANRDTKKNYEYFPTLEEALAYFDEVSTPVREWRDIVLETPSALLDGAL